MKRGDNGGAGPSDGRLDALVDEALREIALPPPVNLKPRVMAAWDERGRREGTAPQGRGKRRPLPALASLRPAAALAVVLLLVAATIVVWQQTRQPGEPGRTAASESARPVRPAPPGTVARSEGAEPPNPTATRAPEPSAEAGPTHASGRSSARRARRPLVEVEFPVEQVTADHVYLPGAPAAGTGEGIAPLSGAPSIPFAPIGPAPTVSDMSEPVSDFPAGDSQPTPGTEHGEPGQSGGPRR